MWWENENRRRVHGCLVHIDIIEDKIWIQADGTERGLAMLDVDCFLTDREVQARANAAKNHAKATEKGRIATFEGRCFARPISSSRERRGEATS